MCALLGGSLCGLYLADGSDCRLYPAGSKSLQAVYCWVAVNAGCPLMGRSLCRLYQAVEARRTFKTPGKRTAMNAEWRHRMAMPSRM